MNVLAIQDLSIDIGELRAVDRVSFALAKGEALGLVGESGCGKTLTARAIMGLLPNAARIASGSVLLDGEELSRLPEQRLRRLRGSRMGMIFQEPMTALNPVLTAGEQVGEVFRVHRQVSRQEEKRLVLAMLERVRLADPVRAYASYPHQLSGGMRQRVMIAMALALDPPLLIADEPTTALDVTVQAEILELLLELQKERGIAVLLITHDLAVVSRVCDRALVMYAGQIVESGSVAGLFSKPLHPYTAGLLRSIPSRAQRGQLLRAIPGMVPELGSFSAACRFNERCERKEERCTIEAPLLAESTGGSDRRARCFFPGEVSV